MPTPHRILIVDHDPLVAQALAQVLKRQGYEAQTAQDADDAADLIEQAGGDGGPGYAILITDLDLPAINGQPDGEGLGLIKRVRADRPDIVPIVVTSFGKVESAVQAMRLGAADYLTKPLVESDLLSAVEKAVQSHALVAEHRALKDGADAPGNPQGFIGADTRMQRVYDLIEAVAGSDTTVLIEGPSGTGKSMAARAIHRHSARADKPFVTFACGSIPESLLESELFGHVKGAFTGADRDKPGKIASAQGGTLFIDEINSATPALQLKLLRVLQDRCYEPVGSTTTVQADVRIVTASNEPLNALVESGGFRQDLFYRINVVNIAMPALSERPGDIALLADHFLSKFCRMLKRERRLSDEALAALHRHPWPGNVRELENAIERAVVLSRTPVIEVDDLPEQFACPAGGFALPRSAGAIPAGALAGAHGPGASIPCIDHGWTPTPLAEALKAPERQILLAALEANDWNRQQTAADLNINRTTLYKKIKQYRLDEPG